MLFFIHLNVKSATIAIAVADPVGFDEVRSNPPFLVRPWLNIARYLFAIHSKRIVRYPLVSVDQVRFGGELLFFFLIFFFFSSFFFLFFLSSLSLSPGMGSVRQQHFFFRFTHTTDRKVSSEVVVMGSFSLCQSDMVMSDKTATVIYSADLDWKCSKIGKMM